MNDLRNISCTALVSKVFESYLLKWLKEEVPLKTNQFGGVKCSSVERLLCGIWHEIGTNQEDHRAATVVTAIDYAKAFNRLFYRWSCLQALTSKGASTQVLGLVATFLSNRTMKLKVGNAWSEQLDVCGGVPQGSLISVYLFNALTDDLENSPGVHDRDPLLPEDERTDNSQDGDDDSPNEMPFPGQDMAASTPRAVPPDGERTFGTPTCKVIPSA
jgi:hypothetical protein